MSFVVAGFNAAPQGAQVKGPHTASTVLHQHRSRRQFSIRTAIAGNVSGIADDLGGDSPAMLGSAMLSMLGRAGGLTMQLKQAGKLGSVVRLAPMLTSPGMAPGLR